MKKLLLTLGALTSVAAPVAVVVACGASNDDALSKLKTLDIATAKQFAQAHSDKVKPDDLAELIEDIKAAKTISELTETMEQITPSTGSPTQTGTTTQTSTTTQTGAATQTGATTQTGTANQVGAAVQTGAVGGPGAGIGASDGHKALTVTDAETEQTVVNNLVSTIVPSSPKSNPVTLEDSFDANVAKESFGIENFKPKDGFLYTYTSTSTTVTIKVIIGNGYVTSKVATPQPIAIHN